MRAPKTRHLMVREYDRAERGRVYLMWLPRTLRMRVLPQRVHWFDEDSNVTTTLVTMNASTRAFLLRNRRRALDIFQSWDVVSRPGCECSHCLNDYDCCGRMVLTALDLRPAKGGVYVAQYRVRNV